MKRIGAFVVVLLAAAGLAGCATGTTAKDWCSKPENAKPFGSYEKCIEFKTSGPVNTY